MLIPSIPDETAAMTEIPEAPFANAFKKFQR
jgi:hypothetical protein